MSSRVAPSIELKVEALYSCWAFFDLIKYQGGTQNFDACHFDFILVLSAPQLYQSGHFTPQLHERWCKLVEMDLPYGQPPPQARMANMPRGHFKSTLMVGYIMWRIYRNPNIRMLQATNIRELSEAFIRELRSYYEDETLQETVWNSRPHIRGNLVPDLDRSNRRYSGDENDAKDRKVVWSNQQLQMLRGIKAKEPTILSTSVKAKATGQHYDVVIMDDIVDFENSESSSKIRRVKRWAGDIASIRNKARVEALCGILPDGTRFTEMLGDELIVTGTHYDPNDYYAFIKANKTDLNFAVLSRNIYANGIDANEGYLWSRFTEQMERELRAELSDLPGVFEAQYLNLVNNPALQILSMDYVEWVAESDFLGNRSAAGVTFRLPDGTVDHFEPILAIDPAVSLSSRADYTAICVGGKSFTGRLVAVDFSVGHFSTEKTLSELVAMIRKWGVSRMYVETVGFQSLLRPLIIKKFADESLSCGVLDFNPSQRNKQKRIETRLSPYFSEGKVVFSSHLQNMASVVNSINFFGRASAKDDPPDALSVVEEHSYPPKQRGSRHNRIPLHPKVVSMHRVNRNFGGIY